MKRISIIFYLFLLSSYCISFNSSFKEISILDKFKSSQIIEVKINAAYDQKIVDIFKSLKKDNQQVTLYFDRHSLFGIENLNQVLLESNVKTNEQNITYYTVELYKVVGKEILIYPFNYSVLLRNLSTVSLGLIPTQEEFELGFDLLVSKSQYESKNKVAKVAAMVYVHIGIDYSKTKPYYEFKDEGILQSYEMIARYILN